MNTHAHVTASSRAANRVQRAAYHFTGRLNRLALRGQLGPLHETELARLTGARR